MKDLLTHTATPYEFEAQNAPGFRPPGYCNLQSVALANYSTELVDLLLESPPPAGGPSGILFHHAHGRATVPNPDSAFAIRKRHLILGIRGMVPQDGVDPERKTEVFSWASNFSRQLRERGVVLNQGYWSFTPPEFCDSVEFYGQETTERLRKLKQTYNPGNCFPQAYPILT